MKNLTDDMTDLQIIEFAKTRCELPWAWGLKVNPDKAQAFCQENGLIPVWAEPILPGDCYIACRNTGFKLLTCRRLGEACVFAKDAAYAYDFNECVKVV